MSKTSKEEVKQKVTRLYEGIVYNNLTKGEAITLEEEIYEYIQSQASEIERLKAQLKEQEQ